MRAMKDSGIEWIGQIPEGWKIEKLKYNAYINMGQSPSSDNYNQDGIGFPFLQGNADFGAKNPTARIYSETANKVCSKGDLLLSVRAPIGALNYADQIYAIGRGLCAISGTKLCNNFTWYLINIMCEAFSRLSTGSTFESISTDDVNNTLLPVPPQESQSRIVDYLDKKCAEIDALIAAKEKTNALLKERRQSIIFEAVTKGLDPTEPMKDSGIEWIGQIPEDWTISRVKHCAELDKEKLGEKTDDNYEFDYIDISSVTEYGGIEDTTEMSFRKSPSRARMIVHTGDTIISTVRTYLKAIAYIIDKRNYICSTGFCVVTPLKTLHPKFAYYLFQSDYFVQKIVCNSVGVSYPAINSSEIGNIPIVFPHFNEQTRIADYLDNKCSEIDSLISANEATAEKLKEYRQSVIYEAVTGKVEI